MCGLFGAKSSAFQRAVTGTWNLLEMTLANSTADRLRSSRRRLHHPDAAARNLHCPRPRRRSGPRQPGGRARRAGHHQPHIRARQSRSPPRRRVRSLRRDPLPGCANGDGRDDPGRGGDRRPGADAERCNRVGVLQRVLRRTHRNSVQRLAGRRRSALPAVEPRRCVRRPAWEAELARPICGAPFARPVSERPAEIRSPHESSDVSPPRLQVDPAEISGPGPPSRRTSAELFIKHLRAAQAGVYLFNGHGSGHGVGLCDRIDQPRAAHPATERLAKYFRALTSRHV